MTYAGPSRADLESVLGISARPMTVESTYTETVVARLEGWLGHPSAPAQRTGQGAFAQARSVAELSITRPSAYPGIVNDRSSA